MPDDEDYAGLHRLLTSAPSWTAEDAATARALLRSQEDTVASAHLRDNRRRDGMQAVVNDLRAALTTWEQAHG